MTTRPTNDKPDRPRPPEGGLRRVIVESASPEVDAGRYPAKRIVGDVVVAECDLMADGHDAIAGRVLFRPVGDPAWQLAPLVPVGNDRWRSSFVVNRVGLWELTFEGWVDAFTTWRRDTEKKLAAAQDVGVELLMGALLLDAAAVRATKDRPGVAAVLEDAARSARDVRGSASERFTAATCDLVVRAMDGTPELANVTRCDRVLRIVVDPELARFSAWYELFPRSCGEDGKRGTFADVERRLAYVASMGFAGESFQVHDVLSDARYLWTGARNYVELDPSLFPVSLFVVRRKVRSEHDFEYFL